MRQVIWRSSDGGVNYSGAFVSPNRAVTPVSGCYWGDYDGIASDMSHSSVYTNWSQSSDPAGNFSIRGLSIAP